MLWHRTTTLTVPSSRRKSKRFTVSYTAKHISQNSTRTRSRLVICWNITFSVESKNQPVQQAGLEGEESNCSYLEGVAPCDGVESQTNLHQYGRNARDGNIFDFF